MQNVAYFYNGSSRADNPFTGRLGPWLNVTSGIAEYPWRHFILWDVLGNLLWVALNVTLGYIFSGRVQALEEVLGNLAWVILSFIVAVISGWKIVHYLRS